MELNWIRVKQVTLWSYEDLVKKLQDVLAYPFVQVHYNHTMPQALDYARRIRSGYFQNRGEATYIDAIASNFEQLEIQQVGNYSDLVQKVATRQQCVSFLDQTGFDFEQLIQVLNYLLRLVLPFKNPLREFIDTEKEAEIRYLGALKALKLSSNLDLLEAGRTEAGRLQLVGAAEIPVSYLLPLVHKADISRLAYSRGKTVRHLCGGGYDTLEKIVNADLKEMEARMDAYYKTLGKSLADFKAVIPLPWIIGGAQVLPRVVEE
jgi:hypothetical protein